MHLNSRRFRRLPTSIETLEPDSPILTALSKMQPPAPPHAAIQFHSIIGSLRPTGVDESTDGVVPWTQQPSRRRSPRRSCARTTASRRTPRRSSRSPDTSAQHVGVTSHLASGRPRGAGLAATWLPNGQAGNAAVP